MADIKSYSIGAPTVVQANPVVNGRVWNVVQTVTYTVEADGMDRYIQDQQNLADSIDSDRSAEKTAALAEKATYQAVR